MPRGGVVDFTALIPNCGSDLAAGDLWLSVLTPNSSELLVPDGLLGYPNPLTGQVFPLTFLELPNRLSVPAPAGTGNYRLIGRIGMYPDTIIDEESFGFQVIP